MKDFVKFVYTPAGSCDATLAIAASRSGGVGVLNAELLGDGHAFAEQLDFLSRNCDRSYGIKMDTADIRLLDAAKKYSNRGLQWVIVDAEILVACSESLSLLKADGVRVLAELKTLDLPDGFMLDHVDGLVLKGNESGGFVGEYSSFILLQKWLRQTEMPLYVRGGVSMHVAAACHTLGAAGVILDNQVLLLDESPLSRELVPLLGNLSGNETIAAGDCEQGQYFRLLVRPGLKRAQEFSANAEGKNFADLDDLARGKISWQKDSSSLMPMGQDVCFAGLWRKKYGHMAHLFRAMDKIIDEGLPQALADRPLSPKSPMAEFLGTELPIVQGPMARVSDRSEFAVAVSQEGALPMLALALKKGEDLEQLLKETKKKIGQKSWGVGVLGFAPQALQEEQLSYLQKYAADFVIIAGGRPDQAVRFAQAGLTPFLHVPSASLVAHFLQQGARGFIFEGRECGGHVGPLSSFVLWSSMVDKLLEEIEGGSVGGDEIQLLFAGGIHDVFSSAFVQVLAAPLTRLGVKVGVIMGSGYLFTKEIVSSGAVQPTFQKAALDCMQTVNLESGPGHASRCAYTPFAKEFLVKSNQLQQEKVPLHEKREVLDDLIMGRLRIASKGCVRSGAGGELQQMDAVHQENEGMFMVGQLATLRREVTDIRSLHDEVTKEAMKFLRSCQRKSAPKSQSETPPADIAIIGVATLLPGADTSTDYWDNILHKVNAISEIPAHRWDWQLYYHEDRQARDKIYSRWGGFLNDVPFDPTRYGMPPNSVESVDPMQLMALQVASNVLADSGYSDKYFDRDRTSVVIGASGGTGDVGLQYGLRAELPRFIGGDIPPEIAESLPEWSEDTFAGILVNVIAGRIANRLNLGGVNFTTDAACASSLAAIYQGVNELAAKRSDFVIAGGVDTVQGPFGFMCFSKTQAFSPRGKCNTFDAGSDGIVISEGIGMVALKRLEDAERDGDRIYAVIKGVGGSSDGKAKGLSAPLPEGQLQAMKRAYMQAGFGPDSLDLFEAHGTGTVAGDTAELKSTTKLIKEGGGRPRQAVVGSVKTLIGHTKATAGIVGMIKAALALHHRVLPPHAGVTNPNPVLRDESSPLFFIEEPRPWLKANGLPRRAAASAFGFGGSNFHVVLEEYTREYRQWLRTSACQKWSAELFVFSAVSKDDLAARLRQTQQEIRTAENAVLRDIAYRLADLWHPAQEIMTIVASSISDLENKIELSLSYLTDDAAAELPPRVYHNNRPLEGKIAVLFPGQGAQYLEMMRELACLFPVCSESLGHADSLLAEKFSKRFGDGVCLSHFIYPRGAYDAQQLKEATVALTSTDVAQPALGAVEAGLWQLLQSFGVEADMFAGHSYGEYVALHAGGYLDFETLMTLSEVRGRSIVDAAAAKEMELGTMAAVMAGREQVEKGIAGLKDVVVANYNGPQQCIISGSEAAVSKAMENFTKAEIKITELPVAAAFHSPYVANAQDELVKAINSSTWQPGTLPVYSNTTAEQHQADVAKIKKQMADHLVNPVEFEAEISAMYRDGARIFLEIGPKSILTRMVGTILGDRPHQAIALEGEGNGIAGMLSCLGQLICHGVDLQLKHLFAGRDCRKDPEQRNGVVSPHTWMLNGSGARRADEPLKRVGVRKGEYRAVINPAPQDSSSPVTTSKIEEVSYQHLTSGKVRQEALTMGKKWLGSTVENSTVMEKYFETMHRFLGTQESVMAMYLGSGTAARGDVRATLPTKPRARLTGSGEGVNPAPIPQERPAISRPAETVVQAVEAKTLSVQEIEVQEQVQQSPAAAPPPVEAAPPVQASGEQQGQVLGKDQITDMLLSVVMEKTGYPKDMLGLKQGLEADLGIDSIKRVEIVSEILQILAKEHNSVLGESERASLNTQETLQGMVDVLAGSQDSSGGTLRPFPEAGTERITDGEGYPFRHVLVAKEDPLEKVPQADLVKGHFLLTEDTREAYRHVVEKLTKRGCTVSVIERELLHDADALRKWCTALPLNGERLAGIIHLAPLESEWLDRESNIKLWREQLHLNEKSLFIILHHFSGQMTEDCHVVSVSGLGGDFGRLEGVHSGVSLQGGSVGLLKSFSEERPGLRIRVIDFDLQQPAETIADILVAEMAGIGGRQEVGYPRGKRTIFTTVAAPVEKTEPAPIENAVVLATGGLKGITAETLRELAQPGNTLIITGRSALPASESPELQALKSSNQLQDYFIGKIRAGELVMTPAQVKKKVASILSAREMLNNLDDFCQRGATVEYHAVGVTDEVEMARVFEDIYKRHGRIDGVVHGAGVIEDKLLADKTEESWSRVVETKVLGALLLQKLVRPDRLRFFVVFGSVAGRYGNSGQSDYATANELMSRLCCQLKRQWPEQVSVRSLCWGPWGKTKFGVGMVTAETEAKFADKGVLLVTPEMGRPVFRYELTSGNASPVEIICGQGPWEQYEAARSADELAAHESNTTLGPLLCKVDVATDPKGRNLVAFKLDNNHLYLDDHLIDSVPVLPAAVALEIMAEAATSLWPGWLVTEALDIRLLKGIELKDRGEKIFVSVHSPTYGSSERFEVAVAIYSQQDDGSKQRIHYRGVLGMQQQLPVNNPFRPKTHTDRQLSSAKAYAEFLFHGPIFQVIENIEGLSENGATALVRSSRPSEWLEDIHTSSNQWIFDPALVDAAAQMAIVWSRTFHNETSLPVRFGKITRHIVGLPERLRMCFERLDYDKPHVVRADVYFLNEDKEVVFAIEELECVSSEALNRLGGTAGLVASAAV